MSVEKTVSIRGGFQRRTPRSIASLKYIFKIMIVKLKDPTFTCGNTGLAAKYK